MVLKLKPVDDRAKKNSQQDTYLVKFTKLFQSTEQICAKDLPFSVDSSPEKIVETILEQTSVTSDYSREKEN